MKVLGSVISYIAFSFFSSIVNADISYGLALDEHRENEWVVATKLILLFMLKLTA